MSARLVSQTVVHASFASVPGDGCRRWLADTVKGGEISDTMVAIACDLAGYSTVFTRPYAVKADPEPMLAGLVSGCTSMAITARVPAVACSHGLPVTVKGSELSYMAQAMDSSTPRTAGCSTMDRNRC